MDGRKKQIQNFLRVFLGRGIIVYFFLVVILFFIFCAVFAPIITKYDPNETVLQDAMQGVSSSHMFGTDAFGRDILTRLIYGTRVSLMSAILSCAFAAIIGMFLGLIAAYYEGAASVIIMRYVDVQLSIPPLLFTIVLGVILGHSFLALVITIGFGLIPGFTRLMYSLVISTKNSDYVTALKLAKISNNRIIFRHLLPNTFPTMIVMFATNLGGAIMLESTLSFLNIGITAPTASWGGMVSDGYTYIFSHPLMAFLPGICIMLLVVAFNILGDALRDALDPRLRGKL
jgi:peptide/nickel transport system permease protein